MTNLNNKLLLTNKWLEYKFAIANILMSDLKLIQGFNKFKEDVLLKLDSGVYITVILKFKTDENIYRNISNMQIIRNNKSEHEQLLDIFQEFWSLKNDEYLSTTISEIVFTYKIIDAEDSKDIGIKTKLTKPKFITLGGKSSENNNLLKISSYKFPNTMDLYEWGDVHFYDNEKYAIVYKKNSKAEYHITFEDNNTMKVEYKLNDKVLLEFKDQLTNRENLNCFIRRVNNTEYHFDNGKMILKRKSVICKKIKILKQNPYSINKFLTLDIETKVVNNVMIPYAICYFDGKNLMSYYETDFIDSKEMIKTALSSLFISKYNQYKVYVHNLSNFDGIFLFKILTEIGEDVKFIINDGRLMDITVKYKKKYSIHLRDSLLMLPSSLKKLSVAFNVEEKSIFPYKFVDDERIKNKYNGEVPKYEYFDKISLSEYNEYCDTFKNRQWNLREETLKYCGQDVRTLFLVLDKFFKQNFLHTRVNPSKCLSLPSLAFTNFRSNFLDKNLHIPILTGNIYNFIKLGYMGGAVDVYKPYGKGIYRYDVNSLYPFIMKTCKMPVNNPTIIEGDSQMIEQILNDQNKFSFIHVNVTCPNDLKIPLLLTKHKVKNGGSRSIAPVGNWEGIYTNVEILRGLDLGYTFEYKKAVYFDSDYIFKDYVDFYYDMKKNSKKNTPEHTIAKQMLNSLYGRLGMSPFLDQHIVADVGYSIELEVKHNMDVRDVIDLKNGKELITYQSKNKDDFTHTNANVNVAIAAAVTSCARVHMSYLKNMNGITLYYSDTDSIDLDKPLDSKYIGPELGQLKLEHIFDEAVYLAPKVYGGKNQNYEYIKIKGLKNPINFDSLKTLLKSGSTIEAKNEKWHKNIVSGQITIKDEIYTISITDSKRQLIYDTNNNFIDTKPIVL